MHLYQDTFTVIPKIKTLLLTGLGEKKKHCDSEGPEDVSGWKI